MATTAPEQEAVEIDTTTWVENCIFAPAVSVSLEKNLSLSASVFLSHTDAKRLTLHGIRPSCYRHEHILQPEADQLRAAGEVKEVVTYRTVTVNGKERQIKDAGPPRVTFKDSTTWVKVYLRQGLSAQLHGPGMPVMQFVRG